MRNRRKAALAALLWARPALATFTWKLGQADESCDTACTADGKICNGYATGCGNIGD